MNYIISNGTRIYLTNATMITISVSISIVVITAIIAVTLITLLKRKASFQLIGKYRYLSTNVPVSSLPIPNTSLSGSRQKLVPKIFNKLKTKTITTHILILCDFACIVEIGFYYITIESFSFLDIIVPVIIIIGSLVFYCVFEHKNRDKNIFLSPEFFSDAVNLINVYCTLSNCRPSISSNVPMLLLTALIYVLVYIIHTNN